MEKLLEINILENLMRGKMARKRMQTEKIISNPPPTGVPNLAL